MASFSFSNALKSLVTTIGNAANSVLNPQVPKPAQVPTASININNLKPAPAPNFSSASGLTSPSAPPRVGLTQPSFVSPVASKPPQQTQIPGLPAGNTTSLSPAWAFNPVASPLQPNSAFRTLLGNGLDALSQPLKGIFNGTPGAGIYKDHGITEALKGGIGAYNQGVTTAFTNRSPGISYASTGTPNEASGMLYSKQPGSKASGVTYDSSFGQNPIAIATLSDGQTLYSDGTKRNSTNTPDPTQAGITAGLRGNAQSGYDKLMGDTTGQKIQNAGGGAWTVYQDQVNQLGDLYQNGQISQEEYYRKAADAQQSALNNSYNALKDQANSLIPQYQAFGDQATKQIDQQLNDAGAAATKNTTSINNTYGDQIRQATLNKQQLDNQRRNQFSALGTADSSAFIDNQTNADSQFLHDQTNTQNEQSGKVADIQTALQQTQRDADNQKTAIRQDTQNKIQGVMSQINLSDADRQSKLSDVVSNMYTSLAALQNDFQNKQASLLESQLSAANNIDAINQEGQVNSALINQQYNLQNSAGQILAQAPPEVQSFVKGLSGRTSSSYADNLKKQQLEALYPSFSQLIERAFSGQQVI